MENIQLETLSLENQKKLNMTHVESVDGFSEQSLKLTVVGKKVTIIGERIKIVAYNKSNGVLVAEGLFNEIKYQYKKQPLIKRLLK